MSAVFFDARLLIASVIVLLVKVSFSFSRLKRQSFGGEEGGGCRWGEYL